MSLMQQAYDTYMYAEAGRRGPYRAGEREPLAPVGHMVTKAAVDITLDRDGRLLHAGPAPEEDAKTVFPVREDSAGRTNRPVPHPLCDQIQYLDPSGGYKYTDYLQGLEEWETSAFTHPVLSAVLKYVKRGTLIADLEAAGLIRRDEAGRVRNAKDFVRWTVTGIGRESGPCWKNRELQQAYISWYRSLRPDGRDLCMISGESAVPAGQHAKGIVPLYGNAKLISANDSVGLTYRGRFLDQSEALCIGYEASQKVHNALRWVIANRGIYYGRRCFVCWSPQGAAIPGPTCILLRREGGAECARTPEAYLDSLHAAVGRRRADLSPGAAAVTAAFDAATSGRLSLTYYSELPASELIGRLGEWEAVCCWPNGSFGIQSPALAKITRYAFGTLRPAGFEADDNITRQVMLQLVACRLEGTALPQTVERALVQKAGNLQAVPDDAEHRYLRSALLFTACAVIRKYRYDRFGELWSMELEPQNPDRSYRFGRLMAVLEKIEQDTFGPDDRREASVIRRQAEFVIRPGGTAVSVLARLRSDCWPQLPAAARRRYAKLIASITQIPGADPSEPDRPLDDVYLPGYYLQKKELCAAQQ